MEILVGVDGSVESDAAVAWAVTEARVRGCGLSVVHCCESRYYGLWTTTRTLREGLREMAQPLVDDALALAARLDPTVAARGTVLVAGPSRALIRLSTRAALMVIGRPDRGALSRLLLGSITRHVLANAACPVVAVAGTAEAVATPARVVAAIRALSANEQTLRFAFAEASRHHVPVHMVHVLRPDQQPTAPLARTLASSLIPWQAEYPALAVTSTVGIGAVAETLAAACTSHDLLVLGHHRRGLAPHALGLHAVHTMHQAPCPVAVVHEPIEVRATEASAERGEASSERAMTARRLGPAPAGSSTATETPGPARR